MINNKNSNKIFLAIIAILVVANIGMLIFFLQKPDRQPQRQDRKAYIAEFLKKEIGFNATQLVAYDSLSTQHRRKMSGMSEKLRGTRADQFKKLAAGNYTDSTIDALAARSASAQHAMELIMLNHLKNIRLLCTPNQVNQFDSLFVKVLNRRGGDRKKQDK